jgi:hypothetical protein
MSGCGWNEYCLFFITSFSRTLQPQQKLVEYISTNRMLTFVHIYTYPVFQETQEMRSRIIYNYNMAETSMKVYHGTTHPTE